MYDAIVVGARCAGSPTAMLLARDGYQVLMLDKDQFPSDILSTHYIHQAGVARLQRWGLLERVVATNCPPISKVTVDFGPVALSGTPPLADGQPAYCPRRRLLDQILIDAAVAAGAEFREGFAVHELIRDGDRVTGVRGRVGGGAMIEEQARIVVGADGMHSIVARAVAAPEYEAVPTRACGYYSYFSDCPTDRAAVYLRGRRNVYSFPTNDGLTCLAAQWPADEFHTVRGDIEAHFDQAVALVPELAERVHAGKREERFVGTGDVPNFYRKPYGDGWALVGDAGYHKDPVTGQGIFDSFRDAESVAAAIDAGFSGRQPLEQALAEYEGKRNATTMPIYQQTLQMVSFEPPPTEVQAMIAAVHASQAETDRFLGLLAGTTSFAEYFAPENIQRVMAAAQPA